MSKTGLTSLVLEVTPRSIFGNSQIDSCSRFLLGSLKRTVETRGKDIKHTIQYSSIRTFLRRVT